MDLKDSWAHFREGVPVEEFRARVNDMDEAQLQYLHKQMQRKRIGGGTSAVVGAAALLPTCGVSVVGIAIGGRRIVVNTDRIDIIEKRLKDKGWDGHHLEGKDFALPITAAIVGLGVGFGLDALIDGMSGGGDALASSGGTPAPPIPDSPEMANTSVPVQDIGASGYVPPPPPPAVPDVSWMQTDAGIQMASNGVPVDSAYAQDTDSGLFQDPLYPADPAGASDLAWAPPVDSISVTPDTITIVPSETDALASTGGFVPGSSGEGWLAGGAATAIAHLGSNITQHGLPHVMQNFAQQAKETLIEKGGEAAAKGGYQKAWQMVEDKKLPRRLSKWLK